MPLAKCLKECWDSQATIFYWPGQIADIPEDHVFIKAKCFRFVSPEDIATDQTELQVQLKKAFEMIAELQKQLETKGESKTIVGEMVETEKRGPGRPPKS